MRIARDLHDGLGHRLTALSLHLEAASHRFPEASPAMWREAQAQVKEMLWEIRQVVGELREQEHVHLCDALRALAEGVERPIVHVCIEGDPVIEDPARATALARCAQELITNAMKHAGAENLWIEVESHPEGILLRARDDGRCAPEIKEGHGLLGMRERLRAFGGRLDLATQDGGLRALVWLPTVVS
jgi:signal transduction histidine kinase